MIKVGNENCKPKKVTIELDPDEIVLRTSQASASKEWYLKVLLSLILGDLDSAENYLDGALRAVTQVGDFLRRLEREVLGKSEGGDKE